MPFITLEGIDGSGKSTVISLLKEKLIEKSLDFIVVREPGGTPIGEKIRTLLLDPRCSISPIEEVYLYASSRATLVREVILPALSSSKIIISERYLDSSLAYQGYGKGVPLSFIYEVNRPAIMDLYPDLTILLDIDPNICMERLKNKKKDRIELEGLNLQKRVRCGYLKLAEIYKERYLVVDATKEPQGIVEEVWERIRTLIR
ncbi:MAG: dTMP kinase [bacterium]|nr:dTMP kinase [bacterium]